METLTIYAKSTSGEHYTVAFTFFDSKVRIYCNCAAGKIHQNCKHKDSFIIGDASLLHDTTQTDLFNDVCSRIKNSRFNIEYQNLLSEIERIEKQRKMLQLEIGQIKKKFYQRLNEGI
ncbi:MAG TPA: hypothetical protein VIL74_20805 [Pyrinomonadaceae bacterium]|jgi:hypothetical protein